MLEQRIDELVQGVLASAREVALAAVSEAFARNQAQLVADRAQARRPSKERGQPRRAGRARCTGPKRSPEELADLGEKLCGAVCDKPGETMTYYAERVSSTPRKLGVPVRRLVEEGRVRAIGDRNQRRYYPSGRE